jgi:hypothetical protein
MTRIVYLLCFVVAVSDAFSQSIRSIDGAFNNIFNPEWGSNGDALAQDTDIGFKDGISLMGGDTRPNPRHISNLLFAQDASTSDVKNLSDFVWVFGQFLDHDLSLVHDNPSEALFIDIPSDDKVFKPGGAPIAMRRSLAINGTGTSVSNPRRYANEVTAFLDGSMVYGSTPSRAKWLRSFVDGKLKTSSGNNMPWNTLTGEFNGPIDMSAPSMDDAVGISDKHFVAGDVRANENPLLIAFHTLFVREHNRMCDQLKEENSSMSDEELYQKARKWTGAFLQSITYNEWLPAMGIALSRYNGYREDVNPQISNVFSAAAFRVGHTLINSNLLRIESSDINVPSGSVSLKDSYFNPALISLTGGVEPYLRGMATQVQQKMDSKVIDDVRNFLFGTPDAGGLDLAAINVNRGRERGLPDYNTVRENFGLPVIQDFNEITKHADVADILSKLYGTPDDVDPWVGMLSEDYMPGAILGSTLMTIFKKQFQNLRDGDRFYYEFDKSFSKEDVAKISTTTMHDIIMRNTDIDIMQDNVFEAKPLQQLIGGPDLAEMDLNAIAYPNPTSGAFQIKLFANTDFDATVTVYDPLGRVLMRSKEALVAGDNILSIDLDQSLPKGYFNVVVDKDQLNYQVLRVIKN